MLEVIWVVVEKIILSAEDKEVFEAWNKAKSEKNFEEADKYRALLIEKGLA